MDDTLVICNNKQSRYAELRDNVKIACIERKYEFENSYGHENDDFKNNIQIITIYLFGNLDNESIGEVNILMGLKKTGLFKLEIVSSECDEEVFEYLFYGDKY